jgi:hypothetical protein
LTLQITVLIELKCFKTSLSKTGYRDNQNIERSDEGFRDFKNQNSLKGSREYLKRIKGISERIKSVSNN